MSHICAECGKSYKKISGLRKHKIISHGRKPPSKKTTYRKTRTGLHPSFEKKVSIKGKSMGEVREGLIENMSQLEKDFMRTLEELKINFISQYQIGTKFFDFYLPDYNVIIEVDGDYHHCNPAIYNRPKYKVQRQVVRNDHRKNRLCEEKGIQLVRFWESDIRNKHYEVIAKIKFILNIV